MSTVDSKVQQSFEEDFPWSDFLWSKHNAEGTRGVVFGPHPKLVLFNRSRVSFVLSSGLIFLLILGALAGTQLWNIRAELTQENIISYAPSFADGGPWPFGWSFSLLFVLSVFIHEAGHWLGFRLTGRRLKVLILGGNASVIPDRAPSNSYQMLLVGAGGPVLQGLFGLALVLSQGGLGWSGGQLIGEIIVLVGLSGLLPLGKYSDGFKIWGAILNISRGRGGGSLEIEPSEPEG